MDFLSVNGFFEIFSNPQDLIKIGGIVLLLVIIYLETGFFLGLVLPGGDYLIFTAGLLAGTQFLDVSILILFPSMMGAAILGDYTGFMKGKWLGPKLFDKEENKIFKRSYLARSNSFYQKYGVSAFIISRFLPVVRTLMPMLAGASGTTFGRFSLYNILGAVIWIGTLAPLGYFLGKKYPQLMDYSVYFLLGFAIIASAPVITSFLRRK
ncbi:MAG: DedA family protein [Bacteroidales bacterium]|nr:DedA family protein [Bacteroidales bacterium]